MTFVVIFWAAVALILHSYVMYPLLTVLIGRRAAERRRDVARTELPTITVVVAAYNEEQHVRGRLNNLLTLDYPSDRVRILLGSDGSTDRTVAIASECEDPRVRIRDFSIRRGKASVLNDLLAEVDAELVVFTDANTLFAHDALIALARNFMDPQVGAVSGELRLQAPKAGDNQDELYWRVETALKLGESRIGGLLGANGAIYAIRRALYVAVPADTIIDDFTIVMNVSTMGWRTVFDPAAVAYEETPSTIEAEFKRRIRIGIGNYQAFFRYPEYWLRTTNVRRFTYVSHKVLRWFTPHLLIVALLANAMLLANALYATLFSIQLCTYGALGIAMVLGRQIRLPRVINPALFLFALNLAFLIGFWRFANGSVTGLWQRTERS